jgi:hypothetical protein
MLPQLLHDAGTGIRSTLSIIAKQEQHIQRRAFIRSARITTSVGSPNVASTSARSMRLGPIMLLRRLAADLRPVGVSPDQRQG